jgi:hypothetical protein
MVRVDSEQATVTRRVLRDRHTSVVIPILANTTRPRMKTGPIDNSLASRSPDTRIGPTGMRYGTHGQCTMSGPTGTILNSPGRCMTTGRTGVSRRRSMHTTIQTTDTLHRQRQHQRHRPRHHFLHLHLSHPNHPRHRVRYESHQTVLKVIG